MIILGIDPGYAIVGYGVIQMEKGKFTALDYGVIKTPQSESISVRLCMIAEDLKAILEKYKPDAVAIEELFFSANRKTGIMVAEARGVILLTCAQICGNMFEYTPMQIKQAITGYGGADKQQIQHMITLLLRLKSIPKPDDAADALAVALCHGQSSKFGEQFRI